uniref:MoxR domain-containing protein n=1 Tax=Biomphalaria glabrata TaxID=6526 RepID=A0A2C9LBR5_BIOGL
MRQPPAVIQALRNLDQTFKALEKVVVGRRVLLRQIMLALITRNHVLLEGPPGVAESFMARAVFNAIEGASSFRVQCTKKMTEDYLVGPLDMHLFREQGEYVHRVEGYLPTAHYAFLDEFMDLSTGALRSLLEVLNERTFSRGPQFVRCPLGTAICASNFAGENDEGAEAVIDRFMFKAKVAPLTRLQDRRLMFKTPPKVPTLAHADIMRIADAVQRVLVPEFVLDTYLQVCGALKLTDRTVRHCVDVLKASAVCRGSTIAALEDIPTLESCFVKTGDAQSEQAFGAAMAKYKAALATRQVLTNAAILSQRVSQLATLLDGAADYAAAGPIAHEIREAQAALNSVRCPENAAVVQSSLQRCESLLNKADTIYFKENKK